MGLHVLDGGFAAPVFDAQRVFRAVMDAMARPGTIVPMEAQSRPPRPLGATAAAIMLTLVDQDTLLWLDSPPPARDAVLEWLGFHTGAPAVSLPADAHFALVCDPAALIALENFPQGSQDYPDRSTTLILEVATLTDGPPLRLCGPGIEGEAHLAPSPLPRHFAEQWRQNGARFPRGVDVILAAPGAIACMPRTTRIGNGEA